jgi:hypothetical protein
VTGWEYWHKKGADGVDLQRVAFVAVAAGKAEAALLTEAAINGCPLDVPGAVRLLDFEQVDYNRREGFNATFAHGRLLALVPQYAGRGRYALYYVNCEVGAAVASFSVRASLYSVLPTGSGSSSSSSGQRRSYLAAGEEGLPRLYGMASAAYACLLALWALACLARRRRGWVHGGHLVLAGLLAAKAAGLLAASRAYAAVGEAGAAPARGAVADLLNAARGAGPLLALAGLAAGTPARLLGPGLLPGRAGRFAGLALPLQAGGEAVLAYLARAGPGGPGATTAAGWLAAWPGAGSGTGRGAALAAWATSAWGGTTRRAIHAGMLAGVALVVAPAAWAARHGGRPGAGAGTAGPDAAKAARAAAGASLFRRCYMTIAAYSLTSRVGGASLARRAAPRSAWVPLAAVEAAGLAFYVAASLTFAPGPGDAAGPFLLRSGGGGGGGTGGGGMASRGRAPASPAAGMGGAYSSRPGGGGGGGGGTEAELAPLRARGGGGGGD